MINKIVLGTLVSVGVVFAADSGYISQTTSRVSLAPQGNLLIATTVTNWDTRASDVLAVKWIAPKGSYCQSSQFTLSRGNAITGDVSWAYRTIVHTGANGQPIVCSGYWVADVINLNNNAVLASAGYTVSANFPASSGS